MKLTAREERWPIAGAFTIARGSKTEARVIVVELEDGPYCGRGEAVPYPRYGETIEQSLAHTIDGTVTLDFAPTGLICTIRAPLSERLGATLN